jgi:hypothetical protein
MKFERRCSYLIPAYISALLCAYSHLWLMNFTLYNTYYKGKRGYSGSFGKGIVAESISYSTYALVDFY